jgi:hypothetical protein
VARHESSVFEAIEDRFDVGNLVELFHERGGGVATVRAVVTTPVAVTQ